VDVEKPREYGASAPTARQLAYKFRPAHIHAVERAVAALDSKEWNGKRLGAERARRRRR